MKFTVYGYEIKEDNNKIIIGYFTLKENPKHPEVVGELKARKIYSFEIKDY